MKIKYNLEEIHPKVFLVTMKSSYDLAMTFCRVQEFYESPFKEIKGKNFNMMEFQKMYTERNRENFFSYPIDWAGFNIPSNVVEKFLKCFWKTFDKHDYNMYDRVFQEIHTKIKKKLAPEDDYYIIASEPEHHETIAHDNISSATTGEGKKRIAARSRTLQGSNTTRSQKKPH